MCLDTMWSFSTKKILVKPFVFVCKPSMFPNIFVIVLKHELEDILAQEESQDATHLNYENW